MRSIEWDAGDIVVIDQTRLPHAQDFIRLRSTEEIAEAIRSLRVRGAPALGIVGAMGVAQAGLFVVTDDPDEVLAAAEAAGATLKGTRPTAINLAWAIERVLEAGRASTVREAERLADVLVAEAIAIREEDEQACLMIGKHAVELFEPRNVVLTHCNTGFLVTGGIGTALGAIRYAHQSGIGIAVVATETRPLLQGARLTTWELGRLGIPHALVVDAAAPGLIARGEITMVMVGADRIAANGDVANKVGTYPLALAAKAAGIPFIVLAPTSTIDPAVASGADIPVEERDAGEVTTILGAVSIAPPGTASLNPAFDVTPAELITEIVTERGIARAPYKRSLARISGETSRVGKAPPAGRTAVSGKPSGNGKASVRARAAADGSAAKEPKTAKNPKRRKQPTKASAKAGSSASSSRSGRARAKRPSR